MPIFWRDSGAQARCKGGSHMRGTRPYKLKSKVNCAHIKVAATLQFGTAESQDESPCGAIHKFKGRGYQAWLCAQRQTAREACQAREARLPETFAVPVIPSVSEPSEFANSISTAK